MNTFFTRIVAAFVLIFAITSASYSQTTEKTILVLDASGSMWGQIEGEAKITIAQRVIGDLLTSLPEGQQLGLTAYGHREKGNCQDIETLVVPGPNTRQAIMDAVNAISPKGKTPLSAAVIAAAEQLRYEEEKATVILVSDGIETCNLDPCAVGAQLEQTGVDFTAHVVGFDISDPLALAQLQCLAENTGGRFITASNASELAQALIEVSVQEEPEPVILEITLNAQEGEDGPLIDADLVWNLTNVDSGESVVQNALMAQVTQSLEAGTYFAEVLRTSDEATAELRLSVAEGGARTFTLTLPFMLPQATIDAVDTAVAGSTISLSWTGPSERNDYISVAEVGSRSSKYVNYTYTREGNTLNLQMPPVPGVYEVRYVLSGRHIVLATSPITVTEVTAELSAPEAVTVGEGLVIPWVGPDYQNDFISVAAIGVDDGRYANYTYTRDGSPLTLEMPSEPGIYELRYVMSQDKTVLLRQEIRVEPVSATLQAPESATAGENLIIQWEGPDYQNDFISVAEIGADDGRYVNYSYTRDGAPLTLEMPSEPGIYELRYVMSQDKTVLARQEIRIELVSASLTAPQTASAGEQLVLQWEGPDYQNDFISVAEIGSNSGRYINYSYTRDGSPLTLEMPAEAGTYELRYVMNQDKTILARQTIVLESVGASVTAPASADAGQDLVVQWVGPDYQNDFISVAEIGTAGGRYVNYTYTREGNILTLEMPAEAGTYEIRYVQSQDKTVLARQEIILTAVSASLTTPANADAGSKIIVMWEGPDYRNDYISIAEVGSPNDRYLEYTYARVGSPLQLQMPGAPGDYEIRYVQKQDGIVLGRQPITVDAATATLVAPATGSAGAKIVVEWTGPDNNGDYISIARFGEPDDKYEDYEYVRNGSPLLIELPDAHGDYEIRYVMKQDRTVLARSAITVGE